MIKASRALITATGDLSFDTRASILGAWGKSQSPQHEPVSALITSQSSQDPISAWEASGDDILARVMEYLGGESQDTITCDYLATCDARDPRRIQKQPISHLNDLLSKSASLARSLDDKKSALIHLDIEYVNFDDPASAFTDPWHAFSLQEPVVLAIEELLVNWGIRPLHLITGQGHHFVWSVARGSQCEKRLAELAFSNQSPGEQCNHAIVFDGTALLMEYFANEVRRLASPQTKIPVQLTAVHVGPCSSNQREMISIDISEYGDPLASRMIRIPFTAYRKPWECGLVSDLGLEDQIGHFVTLPLHEMDIMQCLKCRQDVHDIASLAKCASIHIPEQEEGTLRLIEAYEGSKLRSFHDTYYREDPYPKDQWKETYGLTPIEDFPGCVQRALIFPNDLLLKPAILQLVTRCFLSQGWHPRHVAGLICSKFSDPGFNWGSAWEEYCPARRADFYVRMFSGLIRLGRDPLIDFNCTSQQEKGFCWPLPGSCNLETHYQRLISTNSEP